MQNERYCTKFVYDKGDKYNTSEVDPIELEYMRSEHFKSLDLITKENSQNILRIAANDSGYLLDRKRYKE